MMSFHDSVITYQNQHFVLRLNYVVFTIYIYIYTYIYMYIYIYIHIYIYKIALRVAFKGSVLPEN